uniref:ILEI/PANDER domain-containing protein n=1 Tax=Ciona savignyi TaxID=51511 RepID=H2ZKN8_CIOSA
MACRNTGVLRFFLVGVLLFLSWYTFQLYAELFGRLSIKKSGQQNVQKNEINTEKVAEPSIKIDDPDALIDKVKMKAAEEEWDQNQGLMQPNVIKMNKNPCAMTMTCTDDQWSFKIITGAANVIGPSICFNGTIIMKNPLNNVDRGMNIALLNGKTGENLRQIVFDLYGKDSTELKNFLKELKPEHIILVTTYDDAAFKLDDEAKEALTALGSSKAKNLEFRDNWIFVGGQSIKHPSEFEQINKNVKEKNKYGD